MDEKDIEIVTGDGSNLVFSPVEEHITELTPKPKSDTREIIIPEVTTGNKKNKKNIKLNKKKYTNKSAD